MRAKEKHKHTKNDKEKGTGITKYTGQKKINEGHSIENAIGTQLRDPMAYGGINKLMDAAAEIGRNPVSKHQIQLRV